MNIALKEWAAIVDALAGGRQIALLRKGGIVEAERGGFHLRHREFLLFPAHEHQHARYLRVAAPKPEPGKLRITTLVRVTDALPAPADRKKLLDAGDEFVWKEDFVHQRYDYRPDLPLWLILLRVYLLAEVAVIPDRPSYAGCKSWVHLTEEIDVTTRTPALAEEAFETRRATLLTAIA